MVLHVNLSLQLDFQGGLEDTRGTLFYDYANLIKDVNPKVFIYENVRGLTTHDKGKLGLL